MWVEKVLSSLCIAYKFEAVMVGEAKRKYVGMILFDGVRSDGWDPAEFEIVRSR